MSRSWWIAYPTWRRWGRYRPHSTHPHLWSSSTTRSRTRPRDTSVMRRRNWNSVSAVSLTIASWSFHRMAICEHSRRRFFRSWHWPHVHGDLPIRLNDSFPNLLEDDFSVWSNQIVMAISNMWTYNINMNESLLN